MSRSQCEAAPNSPAGGCQSAGGAISRLLPAACLEASGCSRSVSGSGPQRTQFFAHGGGTMEHPLATGAGNARGRQALAIVRSAL
jgi:hypothetical protein